MLIRNLGLALLFMFTYLPNTIVAAEAEEPMSPVWEKIDPAWSGVSAKVVDFVGEQKQKLLVDLAYAAVTSDVCENLTLDKNKFSKAFDTGFDDSANQKLSAQELAQYGQKVSMYFGVYVGMLTSIGLQERDDFCRSAQEKKSSAEGHFWLSELTTAK